MDEDYQYKKDEQFVPQEEDYPTQEELNNINNQNNENKLNQDYNPPPIAQEITQPNQPNIDVNKNATPLSIDKQNDIKISYQTNVEYGKPYPPSNNNIAQPLSNQINVGYGKPPYPPSDNIVYPVSQPIYQPKPKVIKPVIRQPGYNIEPVPERRRNNNGDCSDDDCMACCQILCCCLLIFAQALGN